MCFFGIIIENKRAFIYNMTTDIFILLLALEDNDKGGELWPIYIRLQIF